METRDSSNTLGSRADARYWLLKLSSGTSSSAEQVAFRSWLGASEENQQAFDELQQLWSELDQVSDQVLATCGDIPARSPTSYWAIAASLTVTTLFAALLWQWLGAGIYSNPISNPVQYSTHIGELRSIALVDGTRIELGAHSKLKTSYSTAKRLVIMERGEAYFDVAPDSTRPFVVSARGGTATAIGTAFTVHTGVRRVTVTVEEGVVAVSGAAGAGAQFSEQLEAGGRVAYGRDGILTSVKTVELDQIAIWRQGRRVFHNTPLDELIEDLNRYSEKTVIVADNRLKEIEVSGVFDDFADTAAVLRAVEQSLPAKVIERSSAIHVLHQ